MLLMGDEVRRSQGGNNNTWCQNNPLGWMHWNPDADDRALMVFLKRLISLRQTLAPLLNPENPLARAPPNGPRDSGLAWREVTLSINSKTHKWNMHNDYARIRGSISPTWRMPSIAANSEAWMALSVPMDSAVRAQERHPKGYALELTIKAKDDNGIEHTFHAYLPRLPVLTASEYNALPTDEMVYRRFTEVESADLQRAARKAVQRRDWAQVQEMLDDIERRAFDNPWLQSTVQMLKVLLSNRDHGRMEKELMFASYSMKFSLS
jgi:hypothetical protein